MPAAKLIGMPFFNRRTLSTNTTSRPVVFSPAAGLELQNVSVTGETPEGTSTILHEITVSLRQPKTAVLGLNGSGKSTFLKLFNGLTHCSAGTVNVHGVNVQEHTPDVRRTAGLLFSDPQAQLIMPTPTEDVELSLQRLNLNSARRRQRALELLTQRGLEHRAHHSIYQLSGGERQLVALTAVLAVEPTVLLLDEPTTLLDLRNALRLMELLEQLPQQMVISTHDLELAARCDEAIIIHEGKLIDQGPALDIIDIYRNYCAQGFPAEDERRGGHE
ncbi:ABC transporter ATP-binding protein [Rothia amarae]